MENSQPGETNVSGGVNLQATGAVNIGGDVIGRDKVTSLPPAPPAQPGFFYPSPRTEFVGRETLLQQLHLALNPKRNIHPRPVALVGMSGVGKTRLVIEYARRHEKSYPGGVYWIDVAQGWEDQIVTRAKQVGLREYAVREAECRRLLMLAFSNFLNTHPQSLLILDGVNDFSVLGWSDQTTGFRFAELHCRILITTHSDVVGLPFETIPVDVLSESEAVEVLRGTQKNHKSDAEQAAARAICGMLGYLPLAVSIAAAFLNIRRDVSLSGYRDRLQREGGLQVVDQTLEELPLLAAYERAVSTTLSFQWSALQNADAKFVLQVIALLGSHTWVTRAQLALLTNLPDAAESGHPVPLETALIPLRQLSLIEETSSTRRRAENSEQELALYTSSPESIRLHTLIQEFVRRQIGAEGNEDQLKDQIENSLSRALTDAAGATDRMIAVGECLSLIPDWKPPHLRELIFEKLVEVMNDVTAPMLKRHQAALLLADLHWLDESWTALFPDTMMNYMEFIARYVDLDTEREHLDERLSKLLDEPRIKLEDRERGELLVFRAVMRAELGRSDEAVADYEEAWRLAGNTSDRLAARVKLGLASIVQVQYESLAESEDPDIRQKAMAGLRSVVPLYWEADDFVRSYGADPILHVIILKELAYVYALLDKWGLGRRRCKQALRLVQQIQEEGPRQIYLAWIQETESQVLFKQGMCLKASGSPTALLAFQTAYDIAQGEIEQLDKYSIKNFDYVLAHNNAGEYLLEESRCPNCREPRLLAARNHLEYALELARRLKIALLEQDAEDFLEEVAARQLEIDRGKEYEKP
jgi:tetratricopeptide (TPR) repeat protein